MDDQVELTGVDATLVSDVRPLEDIFKQYDFTVYGPKLQELASRYKGLRFIKGDGNCFPRAFLYRFLEILHADKDNTRADLLRSFVEGSKDMLIAHGFPDLIEDFWEEFMEALNLLKSSKEDGKAWEEVMHPHLCIEAVSNSLVFFLRLLLSCALQRNADYFSSFIPGVPSVEAFCKQEVEPVDKYFDQVQINAVAAIFRVNVSVAYLGPSPMSIHTLTTPPLAHACLQGDTWEGPTVHVLYRPEHYDLLYV